MELVREDGNVIELKEGERHEMGRCSGLHVETDKSVSRLHVIVELLRPASRKGKEVVGESTALKLRVRVVGRNPICIRTREGAEDNVSSPQIKFSGRGETDWLAPGDKFALSIRQPLFLVLRQCSRGSLGGDDIFESHRAGRIENVVENQLDCPVEKNVPEVDADSVEEEEGIARAVARRQRRRLEREAEQQRMRLDEQQRSRNGELEDPDRVKPDEESLLKDSAVSRQTNDLYPVNPVSEFGFIVKGSEFQAFEKRSKTENGVAWNWKIDKKGENEENRIESKALDGKSKMKHRDTRKVARPEEDDEEWGGDNKEEEERLSKAIGPKTERKVSTRSSRSNPQTLNAQLSNRAGRISTNGGDLIHLSAEHNYSIEEDDEDEDEEEDEDENEWIDDDETVSHQTGKRVASPEKQKPACKYGSKCYRKNEQHLSQFSHPPR